MTLSRWALRVALVVVALAVVLPFQVLAEPANALVRVVISGEVLPLQLAQIDQVVKQGDPMVFVRGTTSVASVPAAVAPVDGRVAQVMVRPGDRVSIGDVVAVIQPK